MSDRLDRLSLGRFFRNILPFCTWIVLHSVETLGFFVLFILCVPNANVV